MSLPRAIVIVLDGVGAGELPDAGAYGDQGSDTLGHVAAAGPLRIPTLAGLGLGRAAALPGVTAPGVAARCLRAGWPNGRPARTRSPGTGN